MNKKFFKTIITLSIVLMIGILTACNNQKEVKNDKVKQPKVVAPEKLPIATITIKNFGVVQAELYPNVAPNTVDNFISLANKGFYNGLTFHRIIKDFMIQGGDPKGTGEGGPGYSINGEFTANGFKNDLKHTIGVLSMARTNDPNSAGSQFFIMTSDTPSLDGQYASFGKVINGMDIVKKVEAVETDSNDAPIDKVVIESIKVDTKGEKYPKPKIKKE